MTGAQKFVRFFMSAKSFEKAKTESMEWKFDCDCGNTFSIWDIGGIRYKAKGNPSKLVKCPKCLKSAFRKCEKK
jgi:hypothetical protein